MHKNEVRCLHVPFSPPDITSLEIDEVVDTLKSGWITTGPKTKKFEQEIALYCGTPRAVCLNSATAALELTLRLFGIGAGDEVITSAYTYTASASVVCHVGAALVLVDTAPESFEMDYAALEGAITPRTKAVIAVDIAGVPCHFERILNIIEGRQKIFRAQKPLQAALGRVLLLADAAHSFGAIRGGIKSGALADFTCFSFHAVKNLTTGEGGAVTWREHGKINSEALYKSFQLLSLHGQSKDALTKNLAGSWEYDIISPAYKCNMTDLAAALGLAQLKRYPAMLKRRHELAEHYDNALAGLDVVPLAHSGNDFCSSGHLYLVRLCGKSEVFRNNVISYMAEEDIATNVHYKPLPMHTAYRALGFAPADYPNACSTYKSEITLPLFSSMTDEQQAFTAEVFIRAIKG